MQQNTLLEESYDGTNCYLLMKKHVIILLSATLALLLFSQSCRKPEKPKDPCKNMEEVTATNPADGTPGHFSRVRNGQTEYLWAVNFHEYASRIKPGYTYLIGYKEEQCFINKTQENILPGGCVVYEKCIRIRCLKEKAPAKTCFESLVDKNTWGTFQPGAYAYPHISGNTLIASTFFSGCSADDPVTFRLVMREPVNGVFTAGIQNMRNGFTCEAYFNRTACYDLNAIGEYYRQRKLVMPAQVTIRLIHGNQIQDLVYNPQ